jgi:hypothetical protein
MDCWKVFMPYGKKSQQSQRTVWSFPVRLAKSRNSGIGLPSCQSKNLEQLTMDTLKRFEKEQRRACINNYLQHCANLGNRSTIVVH